ncbi:dsDNA nuclease domain-containing protein [Paraburkholderia sp. BL9I2N2]|uniref:dsDNA nuclease domain-containing protein n=1 Tax=Paraburkholderia sp. BL9I2N2 TaxID=1938809 RepID=UPI00105211B8|nr:dsDNA nuclease domain-containing protein [Paraburkholderia sp. BL9I2N2]TCK94718.1 uncharacterized protein DUF4297 [Paraburkholderia sp. BL9I2N2]
MGDPITAGAYADTSNDNSWSSVDDACPAEEGGPIARTGFSYQDEVAVGFLIDMLCDPSLVKIHCESHDDILLLRSGEAGRIAEFAQVKGGEADKLWSVADLCYRKSDAVGSSIFEVSLSRDQHRELSRFRIVTHRPAVTALDVLTFPLHAPGRESNGAKFLELFTGIDGYCPAFQSAKGNDAKYWIENCVWDVRADKSNIERANLVALIKLSAQQKLDLLQEHVELLLGELRVPASAYRSLTLREPLEKQENTHALRAGRSPAQSVFNIYGSPVCLVGPRPFLQVVLDSTMKGRACAVRHSDFGDRSETRN